MDQDLSITMSVQHCCHGSCTGSGSGETLACGTGACATAVAAVLNGHCNGEILIHLLGGDLKIEWDKETNHVFMTGPAAISFEGEINL